MSRFSLAICLGVALLGCALIQQNKKTSLLESAGFKMVAANTPEKIQALNTLPAGKIARIDRDGSIYYVYPDASECRCLRVGRQEQYDRYLRLASNQKADLLETTGVNTQSENFKGYDPW
jgi:hypothetical protein